MSDVYSKQLAGLKSTTGSTVLTAPDGYVTVITELDMLNGNILNPNAGYVQLLGTVGQCFAQTYTGNLLGEPTFEQWQGRHALIPGDEWTIFSGGCAVDVSVFGYQLYLP